MKNLLSLLLPFFSIIVQAQDPYDGAYGKQLCQFPKETILEQPQVELIYDYIASDPEINTSREEYRILLIGREYALFKDYNQYRLDSVFQHRDKSKITNKEYHDIRYATVPWAKSPYILKNIKEGTMLVRDRISPDNYFYDEGIIDFHWKMEDGTKTVCGHTCQKATCTFRGRNWTAWYAVDIPQSQGPWKFGGLPGLIMLVEDSQREHVFTVVSIRKGTKDYMISRIEGEYDFKTNREWFIKTQRKMMEDPLGYMQSTGLVIQNPDGSKAKLPKKRQYVFNAIEKA